jgi:poly-gamma-glutamate capsule biosynthesis protein CapA/YwtB (metallophosphatase superfamily)
MESPRCGRPSRDAHEAILRRQSAIDIGVTAESLTAPTKGGQGMATKDKNTKKSMEKKPAQKTLKEKRQAKKAKK